MLNSPFKGIFLQMRTIQYWHESQTGVGKTIINTKIELVFYVPKEASSDDLHIIWRRVLSENNVRTLSYNDQRTQTETDITNREQTMIISRFMSWKGTHCGNLSSLLLLLGWASPCWPQTWLKLPSRTSNLSSRSMLLAWTSLHYQKKALLIFLLLGCTLRRYCPLWLVMYRCQSHGFKTRLLRRGFHTLTRDASFPSPTNVGSHNPPPWESTFSLAYRPMSGSNSICNSQNSPLADIVRFGLLRIVISLMVLKRVYYGERLMAIRNGPKG